MIKISQKGFGLLDVIVAIGIIVISFFAVLGLLNYVVLASRYSSERFIAANLAQEGIEIVRSVRDSNWKADATWSQDLSAGQYLAEYNEPRLLAFADQALNIEDGYYGYDASGTPTKYKRKIYIDTACPGGIDCIRVVAEVTWDSSYSYIVEDYLYDWNSNE